MNNFHCLGNFVADPELRHIASGTAVANFTLAVSRRFKKNGETQKEVAFLNFEAWDSDAETIAKFFKKGDQIIALASIKQDNWTTPEGQKRSKLKFRLNEFHFVGQRKDRDNGDDEDAVPAEPTTRTNSRRPSRQQPEPDDDDDAGGDIPF